MFASITRVLYKYTPRNTRDRSITHAASKNESFDQNPFFGRWILVCSLVSHIMPDLARELCALNRCYYAVAVKFQAPQS